MKKITTSFKETTKDIRLFTIVMAQEEKSDFVKKALDFYIKHLELEDKEFQQYLVEVGLCLH